MIGSFEYAQARIQARHGARASEGVWHRLHSARSLAALLESARASVLGPWVTGIDAEASLDDLELRLRERLRERIAEVASWMPPAWQPAVRWTSTLVDLPALRYLATGGAPLAWMTRDPALGPYAGAEPDARASALAGSAFAFVLSAADEPSRPPRGLDGARGGWLDAWRSRWPPCAAEEASGLHELARLIGTHVAGYGALAAGEAWALRRSLQARVEARFRKLALGPGAAFAHLALLALDLERLRAKLVTRAAFRHAEPA